MKIVKRGNTLTLELEDNETIYSIVDNEKIFGHGYWDFLSLIPRVNNSKNILILGLGLGTICKQIEKLYRNLNIDAVEIDTTLIDKVKEIFKPLNNKFNYYNEDAFDFVMKTEKKYDLIIVDIFVSDRIPEKFLTKDFLIIVKKRLKGRSIVVFNTLNFNEVKKLTEIGKEIFNYCFKIWIEYKNNIILLTDFFEDIESYKNIDIDIEAKKFFSRAKRV